jgi:hypothetical protein
MRRVIRQSEVLSAPAETLFSMYTDSSAHAAITGFPVTIAAEAGAEFRAFGGQLSGVVVAVVEPSVIVQTWRSTKFHDNDPDSILILAFSPVDATCETGRIDLIHLDVPEHDYEDVTKGWHKYYWSPWRALLQARAIP